MALVHSHINVDGAVVPIGTAMDGVHAGLAAAEEATSMMQSAMAQPVGAALDVSQSACGYLQKSVKSFLRRLNKVGGQYQGNLIGTLGQYTGTALQSTEALQANINAGLTTGARPAAVEVAPAVTTATVAVAGALPAVPADVTVHPLPPVPNPILGGPAPPLPAPPLPAPLPPVTGVGALARCDRGYRWSGGYPPGFTQPGLPPPNFPGCYEYFIQATCSPLGWVVTIISVGGPDFGAVVHEPGGGEWGPFAPRIPVPGQPTFTSYDQAQAWGVANMPAIFAAANCGAPIPPPPPVPPPSPPPPAVCPPCVTPPPPPPPQPTCDITPKCTVNEASPADPVGDSCKDWQTIVDAMVFTGQSVLTSLGDSAKGGAVALAEVRHLLSCLGDNFSVPDSVWAKLCKCYDREKTCSMLNAWGTVVNRYVQSDFKSGDLYALLALRSLLESLDETTVDVATTATSLGESSASLGLGVNIGSL